MVLFFWDTCSLIDQNFQGLEERLLTSEMNFFLPVVVCRKLGSKIRQFFYCGGRGGGGVLALTSRVFVSFNCFISLLVFKAREILRRIQRRDLYRFVGQTINERRCEVSLSRLFFFAMKNERRNAISFNLVKLVWEINENWLSIINRSINIKCGNKWSNWTCMGWSIINR